MTSGPGLSVVEREREETRGAGALLGWADLLGCGGTLGCRPGQQAEEEGVSGPAGKTGWAKERGEEFHFLFISSIFSNAFSNLFEAI